MGQILKTRTEYIDWLIKTYPDSIADFYKDWGELTNEQLSEWVWYYPSHEEKWRLSHRGYLILQYYFNVALHAIEIDCDTLSGFQYLAIDRYIKSPHFIRKNVLFLVDERCIVELKLFYNGNLTKFFDSKVKAINSKNHLHKCVMRV